MNSIIKLANGETIIAEIVHQDENTTSVLEPLALEVGEGETGRPMMMALTWIPLTKKINMINLSTQHVVAVADCDDDMDAYYAKSLAILKGDTEKLREILQDEAGIDRLEEITQKLESQGVVIDLDDDEPDPWMEKFGQPEQTLSANTVH